MARLDRVRALLAERALDGLIITHPSNRFWLSGFTAEDPAPDATGAALLVGETVAELWTSKNNVEWAAEQAPAFSVNGWGRPWTAAVTERLRELGWQRVGFEAHAMTVAVHGTLTEGLAGHAALESFAGAIEGLRAIKEPGEIEAIERALRLTDEAFGVALSQFRPGMTERSAAWLIDRTMRELGADGPAFATIVAGGPHSARPHHHVGERPLAVGEPIIVDMGARVGGYNGDLTRTVVLGEPDERFAAVYNAVRAAHAAALEGLRPGLTGKLADDLARGPLTAAGYGDYLIHGLGHGVGVRIHEAPSAFPTSEDVLAPGMVMTVEPGVYIPGWGGVRIEDVVVIEAGGCRNLTTAPKLTPARADPRRDDE